MTTVDWSYWANLDVVPYHDACILALGFDPKAINKDAPPAEISAPLHKLTKIAESHLGGGLPSYATDADHYYGSGRSGVRLSEFRAWGESLPSVISFPEGFPTPLLAPITQSIRWPWGDYETELLSQLAAAAERFWKRYDPNDATTAPTNKEVVDWLTNQVVNGKNISSHVAGVMATILRPDGLPTGPRK